MDERLCAECWLQTPRSQAWFVVTLVYSEGNTVDGTIFFQYLQTLGEPHVDSFNFLLKSGLDLAVKDLQPVEFNLSDGNIIKFALEVCCLSRRDFTLKFSLIYSFL